ncbi:MAG: hypothetical protein GEV28_01425 [Actinophytocola sp.]|uniref:hypothetical protein n=1 Tax=Actinophytocola sp. TaxID=1872138 RepID=UPI0013248128|nr:hypothetical protein [Actinophytocola sp.]MPZ79118.1 hypothetical protein [Actinophytocola sp.]
MGFWGSFVVCRSLEELPALMPALEAFEVDPAGDFAEPWRVWRVWTRTRSLPADTFDVLTASSRGPVLIGKIVASSGAQVRAISAPSGPWETYLHLESLLSYVVVPWAPFDEDGNPLDDDALKEQNARYEREVAAVREELLASAHMGIEAARRAASWARDAGLVPAPDDDLRRVLDSRSVFVEETFFELLRRLGLPEVREK